MNTGRTVALIGSFRQHYDDVLHAWRVFTDAGYRVTSPAGAPITDATQASEFVRFTSDTEEWTNPVVQTRALHRILRADLIYVVAPDGYVGQTTCYEIGRAIQAQRPVYFSNNPAGLPIAIPPSFVLPVHQLVAELGSGPPRFFVNVAEGEEGNWERRLLSGDYLSD